MINGLQDYIQHLFGQKDRGCVMFFNLTNKWKGTKNRAESEGAAPWDPEQVLRES